jgi:SAM-dependent methyltransferase
MTLPDWQLPPGVDRGLWDYLRSGEMVAGYDAQMAASPLAAADVRFCEGQFPTPGRLIDLGCGTGRLCRHFAAKGYECVGVDLSDEMLAKARALVGESPPVATGGSSFVRGNLVDLAGIADGSFDYAACLFSTLGMIRGEDNRRAAVSSFFRVLRPGGRLVLHVHNRWFRGLGWRRLVSGDLSMPQAYGGAPLTLHHFTRGEAVRLLEGVGFRVREVQPVGLTDGAVKWPAAVRAYGYLIAADKPT